MSREVPKPLHALDFFKIDVTDFIDLIFALSGVFIELLLSKKVKKFIVLMWDLIN